MMTIQIIDKPVQIFHGRPLSVTATRWPQCGRITIAYAGTVEFDEAFDHEISDEEIETAERLTRRRIEERLI